MSSCRICGDEPARFRPGKRQALCDSCNADTPIKIGRGSFDKRYWGAGFEDVTHPIRDEFYSDYLTSNLTFPQYCKDTTLAITTPA